jgi:hypothetical protein
MAVGVYSTLAWNSPVISIMGHFELRYLITMRATDRCVTRLIITQGILLTGRISGAGSDH